MPTGPQCRLSPSCSPWRTQQSMLRWHASAVRSAFLMVPWREVPQLPRHASALCAYSRGRVSERRRNACHHSSLEPRACFLLHPCLAAELGCTGSTLPARLCVLLVMPLQPGAHLPWGCITASSAARARHRTGACLSGSFRASQGCATSARWGRRRTGGGRRRARSREGAIKGAFQQGSWGRCCVLGHPWHAPRLRQSVRPPALSILPRHSPYCITGISSRRDVDFRGSWQCQSFCHWRTWGRHCPRGCACISVGLAAAWLLLHHRVSPEASWGHSGAELPTWPAQCSLLCQGGAGCHLPACSLGVPFGHSPGAGSSLRRLQQPSSRPCLGIGAPAEALPHVPRLWPWPEDMRCSSALAVPQLGIVQAVRQGGPC